MSILKENYVKKISLIFLDAHLTIPELWDDFLFLLSGLSLLGYIFF